MGIHQDRSPKTEAAGRPRLGRYTVPEEVAQCQQVGTMTPRHQVLGGQGHTMFLAPGWIAKLVNISPITMVYGTEITIVTGANLNQLITGGGTL